jgi:ParB family chromosome partitioning protein
MAVRKKFDKSVLGRGLDDIGGGRGLDALIDTSEVTTQGSSNLNEIPISQIEPNPDQPRREFDPTAMQELASSIATMGIIAPITLRQVAPDRYQIIAGERRWRASQMAGLDAIPAYIRTADDESVMELALVENIQREDLNAIEIALAYEHLAEQSGMTQEKISERVGKSRTAVTNYMRLLKLPAQIQMALKNRDIDMGHARALLSLDSPSLQLKVFHEVLKNQYSVRKVEEMVQMLKSGETLQAGSKKVGAKVTLSPDVIKLKDSLSDILNAKVQLTCNSEGKGKISIPFSSEDELKRIMSLMGGV